MSRNNYDLRNDPDFKRGVDLWTPNKRRGRASAVPAGTTFIVSNFPAFAHAAVVGTGAASNADSAGGSFINCLCSAASADSSTVVTAGPATRRNWNPRIRIKFCAGNSIASVRWWVGAFASDPSALADLSSISGACFGYDTAVDGTAFWRCESANASATQKTTTTVAVVANESYTGDIVMDHANAQVLFYLTRHGSLTATKTISEPKLVAVHATSIPVAATPLLLGATVTTLTTAAKRIVLGEVSLSQD